MRPEREADHLPPTIVKVKNDWSYTSKSLYVRIVCIGKKFFTLPLSIGEVKNMFSLLDKNFLSEIS